jgi:hypothetical protein
MTDVRVYVNGRGVDAPSGGTALDAVRLLDAALAEEVSSGSRALTDSRGLPVAADAALFHGAIFRVVRGRGLDRETN